MERFVDAYKIMEDQNNDLLNKSGQPDTTCEKCGGHLQTILYPTAPLSVIALCQECFQSYVIHPLPGAKIAKFGVNEKTPEIETFLSYKQIDKMSANKREVLSYTMAGYYITRQPDSRWYAYDLFGVENGIIVNGTAVKSLIKQGILVEAEFNIDADVFLNISGPLYTDSYTIEAVEDMNEAQNAALKRLAHVRAYAKVERTLFDIHDLLRDQFKTNVSEIFTECFPEFVQGTDYIITFPFVADILVLTFTLILRTPNYQYNGQGIELIFQSVETGDGLDINTYETFRDDITSKVQLKIYEINLCGDWTISMNDTDVEIIEQTRNNRTLLQLHAIIIMKETIKRLNKSFNTIILAMDSKRRRIDELCTSLKEADHEDMNIDYTEYVQRGWTILDDQVLQAQYLSENTEHAETVDGEFIEINENPRDFEPPTDE